MRILIATGIMNAGGAESLIMQLLREKADDIEYVLLVHHNGEPEKGIYDDEIKRLKTPVYYIPSLGSSGIYKYINTFCETVKKIGAVDILYSHLNAAGGIISLAGAKSGIPKRIIHCHADIKYLGSPISRFRQEMKLAALKLFVNRYGTAFWACSEKAAERLYYRNKKYQIIPNAINAETFAPSAEKRTAARKKFGVENRFVIGAVGRIVRIKNYEFALKIISEMPESEFVCFGRKEDELYFQELQDMAAELGIASRVHFEGNSETVCDDIQCFDRMILPSHSEGFGMAAIEAQAAGIPVVASERVPREADVGIGLISFEPFDVDRWVNSLRKKTEVPDRMAILKAVDKAGYNSSTAVKRIEELLRHL